LASAMDPPYHHLLLLSLALSTSLLDRSHAFCPYLASSEPKSGFQRTVGQERSSRRALYDSLAYYDEEHGTCTNNCFVNDGGNLNARHKIPFEYGSTITTFDIMSYLSENEYDGSDMCVFSMQELRLPDDGISPENLAALIYLGDSAGSRMLELAKGNGDNVLLSACTIGRIGANQACSNAKGGAEGYDYYSFGDDDTGQSETPTYYEERFCRSAVLKTKIDHPHAITIFRLNSNTAANAEATLEEFRNNHETNMNWAYETQIGADGHMLAKVAPCDRISERFTNPSNMYPDLADDNAVCDYVASDGRQFAEEALVEWQNLCSVWPPNEDGSLPKCHRVASTASGAWRMALLAAVMFAVGTAVVMIYKMAKRSTESSVDKSQLVTEIS